MSGRHLTGRAPYWVVAAALCGCVYGAGSPGTVSGPAASCAGPILTTTAGGLPGAALTRVVPVSPGQKLRIYGYGYQTCHDTNHQPPSQPFRHLTIFVIQGRSRAAVATADARQPGGRFDVVVRMPRSLHSGAATVRISRLMEAPLRLRVQAR